MKAFFLVTAILIASLSYGQSGPGKDSLPTNPHYDKALAEKLGGDDYGMKSYFLVMLKTGVNKTTDKELINGSFKGHMNNINRLGCGR